MFFKEEFFCVSPKTVLCVSVQAFGDPLECLQPASFLESSSSYSMKALPPQPLEKPLPNPSRKFSLTPPWPHGPALRIPNCHLIMHCSGHIWQCCEQLLGHAFWLCPFPFWWPECLVNWASCASLSVSSVYTSMHLSIHVSVLSTAPLCIYVSIILVSWPISIYLSIISYSPPTPIFFHPLWWARHCFRPWEYSREQNKVPALM